MCREGVNFRLQNRKQFHSKRLLIKDCNQNHKIVKRIAFAKAAERQGSLRTKKKKKKIKEKQIH